MTDRSDPVPVTDARIDTLWAQAVRLVTDPGDVTDVVVGVLRTADVGEQGPAPELIRELAAQVRTRAPAPGVITRMDRSTSVTRVPDRPTADERADVRWRVGAEHDDRAPRPRPSRERRWRVVATLGVVGALVAAFVVTRDAPAPTTVATDAGATAIDEPGGTDSDVVTAARAAGEQERLADERLAWQAGIPASGQLVTDQHVARCADAVRTEGRAADYPPVSTWNAGASVDAGASGITSVINERFVCATTESTTYVSAATGVAAGPAEVVRAGPRLIAVLNPGEAVVTRTARGPETVPRPVTSSRQVQVIDVADSPTAPFGLSLRIGGPGGDTFDGPVPDPGPTAVEVLDRTGEREIADRNPSGLQLAQCLASDFGRSIQVPGTWTVTASRELPDDTSVVAARAPGMAGLCVRHGSRLAFAAFPAADPVARQALNVVTRIGAVGGDDQAYTLLSVDPRARRLSVSGPVSLTCVVGGGIGVCVGSTDTPTGNSVLTAYGRDDVTVAGPVLLS